MSKRLFTIALLSLAALTHVAKADTAAFITFDDRPTGPSFFSDAGPAQTLVYSQATFSGGVILGNASSFPAIAFATSPNVYATANFGVGLSNLLTIAINPAFSTSEVSFALFNGETFTQGYTVSAFDAGHNLLTTQLFNLPANSASGNAAVDIIAAGIASVTISATGNPSAFDFLIDSVALNQSVQTAVSPVPLPASLPLFISGLGALALLARRRKQKQMEA